MGVIINNSPVVHRHQRPTGVSSKVHLEHITNCSPGGHRQSFTSSSLISHLFDITNELPRGHRKQFTEAPYQRFIWKTSPKVHLGRHHQPFTCVAKSAFHLGTSAVTPGALAFHLVEYHQRFTWGASSVVHQGTSSVVHLGHIIRF